MQVKLLSIILCLFITFVSAAAIASGQEDKVGWVVSFKDETPDSVVAKTVDALKKAGAEIDHEFSIIKGYAIKATKSVIDEFLGLDVVTSLKAEWKPIVEEDGVVTTFGGDEVKAQ
ncbi:hypothetical protein TWF281_001880 [Arthrobotrys megalospora]